MNKKEIKKGRHSRTLLPGISLLYVVNQIGKIPYLIKDKKAGDPRVLRTAKSGMTDFFYNCIFFYHLYSPFCFGAYKNGFYCLSPSSYPNNNSRGLSFVR